VKGNKDGSNWVIEGREYMLSVEDPKDPTNDICRCNVTHLMQG
jgi:DNA polymerase sigma